MSCSCFPSPLLACSIASVAALMLLFRHCLPLITVPVTPSFFPVSLFPSAFISSYLLHHFPLSFSFSTPSHSLFILTPPTPPPASFSSDDTHTHTNSIPHISNEYLVIILSPQWLSVWLRLSSDSVTNGTTSFSTAAIPQHRHPEMWCSSANAAHRDCRLMPRSDLHIYKGLF